MKKVKKRKLRYKRVFIVLFLLFFAVFLFVKIANLKITNIYIKGNELLTDQEIIDIAKLSDYPKSINNSTWSIESRLESNILIKKATVSKENMTIVKITIEENTPLFYNKLNEKTVLFDLEETEEKYDIPILTNYVPDYIYEEFKQKMKLINKDVLKKMSEIKYDPDSIDEKRFLITMVDGNYVYLTINKFDAINNYILIIKNFENKKGILYLDAGNVFEYFE